MTKHIVRIVCALSSALAFPSAALAQTYGGGGLLWGVTAASTIVGPLPLRVVVLNIVNAVLTFMAMIAVIVIVISGIILVVGGGEDTAKDKTKKMIIYTIVGLLIIALAKALVIFLVQALT